MENTIQVLNNWTLGGTYILEATPTLQKKNPMYKIVYKMAKIVHAF